MHVKSIQIKEEICRPVNVLALYTKTLEFWEKKSNAMIAMLSFPQIESFAIN